MPILRPTPQTSICRSVFSLRTLPHSVLFLSLTVFPTIACQRESPQDKYARLSVQADQYIQAGKYTEARLNLMSALNAKPDEAEGYYKLAEVQVRLKMYQKALESYQSALNLNPKHRDARLHFTTLLLIGKQMEPADSNIHKLLEDNPKDADALVLQAAYYRERNDLQKAKEILNQVLGDDPKFLPAVATLGELASAEGDLAKAEELYAKALEIQPENSPVRMAMADLYIRQGRLDDAQEIFSSLVQTDPKNSGLRFYFGEFLLSRGLGDKALEQYRETIKNDATQIEARDRLYDMYLTKGQTAEAKSLTAELAKLDAKSPAVEYFRGRDFELDNNLKDALDSYIKSMAALHTFSPVYRRAGLAEGALGQRTISLEHLNQAISINEYDIGARLALAQDAFLRKEFSQALVHVGKVLERFPRQLGANILKGDIAVTQGDYETARKIFLVLIAAYPQSPMGYVKMGLLEELARKPEQAIEWYKKGISFDRKVLIPATRLAQLIGIQKGNDAAKQEIVALMEASKNSKPELKVVLGALTLGPSKPSPEVIEQARKLFLEAVEERPELNTAYFALARIDTYRGDFKNAVSNYEKLVELQPKHIPSRMLLAVTYESLGELDKAKQAYRDLLSVAPRFAPAANNLAWLLVSQSGGDLDEALRLALIAKEGLPTTSGVADTLGWTYYLRGSYQAALGVLEEAVSLDRKDTNNKPNPEILFHLGAARLANGNSDGAKEVLREATDLANKLPENNQKQVLASNIQKKLLEIQ